jgi:transcriptional regulator with GAF, ATPase, and Fis domain
MKVTALQAMARATSTLVAQHDVTDVLTQLLEDASDAMGAAAAGMLLLNSDGALEVFAATSHRALDLEIYESQERRGPCAEAATTDSTVVADRPESVRARWPQLAPLMADAGYRSVHAHPLHWHGQVLGAINIFHGDDVSGDSVAVGQTFADVATLVMLTPTRVSTPELTGIIESALSGRTVVEQAKGVLAHQQGLTMEQAYDELLRRAREGESTVTETADHVIRSAYGG